MEAFDSDRYLVDQLIRPIANLYQVTPLAAGETPAGPPVAYVRQKKLAIREDIGGARYDVIVGEERIGVLDHMFKQSLLRSTWTVRDGNEAELMIARERSLVGAIARRAIDFVPDIGAWIPIPYNFDFLVDGSVLGGMDRKFQLRDRYIVDIGGDHEKRVDRRLVIALAIGLDTLQN